MRSIRAIFLILLTICLSATSRADENTVIVGALLPLTGGLGFVGEDIRSGMELALPETESSSVKLKVIYMIVRDGKMVRFVP